MRFFRALVTVAVIVGATGCTSVPPESVELSVTLGRDLTEARRANRELALRYFGRMRADVETFIRDVYRPYVIRQTMESLNLLGEIEKSMQPGSVLDPLDIMEVYTTEALTQLEAFRRDMLTPIAEQEQEVVEAIDTIYQRLLNANSIVTGHLASIRKVQDAEAEFLRGVGVGDLREKVGGRLASLSSSLDKVLDEASRVRGLLDEGPAKLKDVKKILDDLPGKVKGLTKGGTSP